MSLAILPATPADVPLLISFIRKLAEYEKMLDQVVVTDALLHQALFGARPAAEAIIARWEDQPAGFALFTGNFSTFVGRPGIYLEDLFVEPEHRGKGIGKALLLWLALLAVERDCGRLEWSVLDWNEPAIGFYRKLGAVAMDEWTVYRLSGEALRNAASQHGGG